MQEVTRLGFLKRDIVIQYVADDLQKERCDETILYESWTLSEFKRNFETYDRLREEIGQRTFRYLCHLKTLSVMDVVR